MPCSHNQTHARSHTAQTDTVVGPRFLAYERLWNKTTEVRLFGFDVTNAETFQECRQLMEEDKEYAPKNAVVVAFGTKADLSLRRQVGEAEARRCFQGLGVPYCETSSKTGQGVNELFEMAITLWCQQNPAKVQSLIGSMPNPFDNTNNAGSEDGSSAKCLLQ